MAVAQADSLSTHDPFADYILAAENFQALTEAMEMPDIGKLSQPVRKILKILDDGPGVMLALTPILWILEVSNILAETVLV